MPAVPWRQHFFPTRSTFHSIHPPEEAGMISAWALCVTVVAWGSALAGLVLVADMIRTDLRCRRVERPR
jgi:hypothetical protein